MQPTRLHDSRIETLLSLVIVILIELALNTQCITLSLCRAATHAAKPLLALGAHKNIRQQSGRCPAKVILSQKGAPLMYLVVDVSEQLFGVSVAINLSYFPSPMFIHRLCHHHNRHR